MIKEIQREMMELVNVVAFLSLLSSVLCNEPMEGRNIMRISKFSINFTPLLAFTDAAAGCHNKNSYSRLHLYQTQT